MAIDLFSYISFEKIKMDVISDKKDARAPMSSRNKGVYGTVIHTFQKD